MIKPPIFGINSFIIIVSLSLAYPRPVHTQPPSNQHLRHPIKRGNNHNDLACIGSWL